MQYSSSFQMVNTYSMFFHLHKAESIGSFLKNALLGMGQDWKDSLCLSMRTVSLLPAEDGQGRRSVPALLELTVV